MDAIFAGKRTEDVCEFSTDATGKGIVGKDTEVELFPICNPHGFVTLRVHTFEVRATGEI